MPVINLSRHTPPPEEDGEPEEEGFTIGPDGKRVAGSTVGPLGGFKALKPEWEGGGSGIGSAGGRGRVESFQQKLWEPPELSTLGNARAIIEEIWLSRLEEHVFMNRDGESESESGLAWLGLGRSLGFGSELWSGLGLGLVKLRVRVRDSMCT